MRRFSFPFTLCLVLAVALNAVAAQRRELSVKYDKYGLPNGMTVILHEDHSLPVVAVNVMFHVGSKDEATGRTGFAHLFEHLMFMGTKRVPEGELDRLTEAGGGKTNGMTSQDWTIYTSDGPASLLPTMLWIEADRLEDLARSMTLEKLNLQRDIVRNERRQTSEMQPYGKAELMIPEVMYPEGHPYHHPVIGSHADLQAASVDDVKEFFNTYYRAGNASLVIAGDFQPAQIKPMIEKLFATLPRGSDPQHRTAGPVRLAESKRITTTDNVQFARTHIVYHSPAQYQPGDAEMDLAASILSSGKTSRLYKRLVYEDKLATDVSVYQESAMLGSLFHIVATARPGIALDKIEAAIDEEIARLLNEGPAAEELKRHQAPLEMSMVSSLQSIQTIAMRLNTYDYFLKDPDSFNADLQRYRGATRQSVRDAARKVLANGARLILRTIPEVQDTDLAARNTRPTTRPEAAFTPQLPETFTLSNGIKVMHWRKAELPLVEVSLMLRGGAAIDSPQQSGRTYLAAGMLSEGAGKRNALEFSDALQSLGAHFGAAAQQEMTAISLSVLKRNLDPAMGLYADAILRPRFDEKEWDRVRTLHVQSLIQDEDEPTVVARRVGLKAFFGKDNPYGRPVEGTVPTVKALALEDVKGAYAALAAPAQATFFVAGDLSADEAKAALEKAFGSWKAPDGWTAPRAPVYPPPANQSMRVVIVDKPESVQTVIGFFMPGPAYRTPQRLGLQMVNRVLGGTFTSRLVQNLRERNGFTYGVRSRFVMGPSAGYFGAMSSVQSKVTGAALKEFIAELKRIGTGDISALEAQTTRQLQRAETIEAFGGLGGIVATAELLASNGLPFSMLGEDLSSLPSHDAAKLNEIARSAIPLNQALLVLVGDKQLIQAQIKDLGLPTPTELTASGEGGK